MGLDGVQAGHHGGESLWLVAATSRMERQRRGGRWFGGCDLAVLPPISKGGSWGAAAADLCAAGMRRLDL